MGESKIYVGRLMECLIQTFTQAVNLSFHQGVEEKLARMGTIAVGVLIENHMGYMA